MTLAGLFVLGVAAWAVSTIAAGGGAVLFLAVAGLLLEPALLPPVVTLAALVSSFQRVGL